MPNVSIKERTKLNFKVRNANKSSSGQAGFDAVFELLTADDTNAFYKFSENSQVLLTEFNAKLVDMPIPPGLNTKGNTPLPINPNSNALLIPLMIALKIGIASNQAEKHFCDDFPDNSGNVCAQLMQQVPNDEIEYFTSKDVKFPEIKGNIILKAIVDEYTKTHKGKELFFLPTITPNKTVVYMVFDEKKEITGFLKAYDPNPNFEYGIAMNGWIIYIDQWDCSVFFYGSKVPVGHTIIHSKATLYKMKA